MNTARWIYKDCKTPIYKHSLLKKTKVKTYKDYLKNEHNKPIQKKD
jgi:hypothetical protein